MNIRPYTIPTIILTILILTVISFLYASCKSSPSGEYSKTTTPKTTRITTKATTQATTKAQISQHFINAIEYHNQAARIMNSGSPFSTVSPSDKQKYFDLLRKALSEAKLVDIQGLNRALYGSGDHFRDEFIQGLELFIEGYETKDNTKGTRGQVLIDRFGTWYSNNYNAISARY